MKRIEIEIGRIALENIARELNKLSNLSISIDPNLPNDQLIKKIERSLELVKHRKCTSKDEYELVLDVLYTSIELQIPVIRPCLVDAAKKLNELWDQKYRQRASKRISNEKRKQIVRQLFPPDGKFSVSVGAWSKVIDLTKSSTSSYDPTIDYDESIGDMELLHQIHLLCARLQNLLAVQPPLRCPWECFTWSIVHHFFKNVKIVKVYV